MKNRYFSLNALSGLYLSMFPRLLESIWITGKLLLKPLFVIFSAQ